MPDGSRNAPPRIVVGVDVGGTFTDIFLYDEANGIARTHKVPSTRGDQSVGFLDGVGDGLRRDGLDFSALAAVVHGTTVGTNALLERKGAKTGLITTAGFRDALEMRRRDRRQTWGLWGEYVPVIPRDLRIEVPERVLADGTVRTAVDLGAVRAAAKALREAGCDAVAIVFINAYANPANERAAAEAVRAIWPNRYVSASSDILPEIREFERSSTTTLNAYLQPVVASYLAALDRRLGEAGSRGQLLIVQSNGGVMSVEGAARLPIRTALSGPAAGVIAAAHIASTAGFPNIITGDMGGTSFDVALIAGGKSVLAAETKIDFGMTLRTPMIEITTIGAGGGSIAGVDRGGLLQVGPESAGSDPGPACYGKGQTRPTVTDANLVLGRINAARPIGGKLKSLDLEAAKAAVARAVAEPLGLDVMAAAEAIVRVANSRMAGAIRLVSIERGHDPKRFALMPFGGAGALHAGALMKETGLASTLVPRYPGVTSALGCVIADMRHDFVHTVNRPLAGLDLGALAARIAAVTKEGTDLLGASGVQLDSVRSEIELDMSYIGQTHTVPVPVAVPADGMLSEHAIMAAFEAAYRANFGRILEAIPVRVLTLRAAVIGARPKLDLAVLRPAGGAIEAARTGSRQVWFDGRWHDTAIYDRLALPCGVVVTGPAILEQPDATTWIDPDLTGTVDDLGNLVLRRRE
ncbi:MAG: hydantoinase/oxoprolinase family protein [Alphaproteobacteria bacterium]|nr:hydantoinase/oxoprolinase family protein [Alphaproteobacteria bacterium]